MAWFMAGFGFHVFLALVVAATVGCGRTPGLLDAPIQGGPDDASASAGQGGQGENGEPAALDAAVAWPSTDAIESRSEAGDVLRAGGTGGTLTGVGGALGGAGGSVAGVGGPVGGTGGCTGLQTSVATRQPADVLLVLDRSGSMNYSIDENCSCDPTANPKVVCADTTHCQTRWASLATALDTTLSDAFFLRWGLKLFASPNADACRVTSGVEVPPTANAAQAIHSVIAAVTPAGETPTAAAITTAAAYLDSQADSGVKIIVLATDGQPNCAGFSGSVYEDDVDGTRDAIALAFKAGYLVYVIGIGTNVDNMDAFAQAGGTGSHYAVQSTADLTRALASISKVATCTFVLAAAPFDPSHTMVYLDKNPVPQNASDGWTFGANTQTVLLHGSACNSALLDQPGLVQAVSSCGPTLPPVLP